MVQIERHGRIRLFNTLYHKKIKCLNIKLFTEYHNQTKNQLNRVLKQKTTINISISLSLIYNHNVTYHQTLYYPCDWETVGFVNLIILFDKFIINSAFRKFLHSCLSDLQSYSVFVITRSVVARKCCRPTGFKLM